MSYSELFSAFSYRALDIILDIDTSNLEETDLKKLTSLVVEFEKNTTSHQQLLDIVTMQEEQTMKIKRLLSIADSILPMKKDQPENPS